MGYGLSFSALSFVRKGKTQTMGSLPGGECAVKDVTHSAYVRAGPLGMWDAHFVWEVRVESLGCEN